MRVEIGESFWQMIARPIEETMCLNFVGLVVMSTYSMVVVLPLWLKLSTPTSTNLCAKITEERRLVS